jgi:hypothetical protein
MIISMLLDLQKSKVPMKLVYLHSKKLKANPARVAATQALTLDSSKPQLGLKGLYGLYGSEEWWSNIEQRKMPLVSVAGIIQRAYVAGMDGGDLSNSIDLLLDDGTIRDESIYTNDDADVALFQVGCRVEIMYVLDEMKEQPAEDGGINYLDIPLEMAVSLQPV